MPTGRPAVLGWPVAESTPTLTLDGVLLTQTTMWSPMAFLEERIEGGHHSKNAAAGAPRRHESNMRSRRRRSCRPIDTIRGRGASNHREAEIPMIHGRGGGLFMAALILPCAAVESVSQSKLCSASGYGGGSVKSAVAECAKHWDRSVCAKSVTCSGFGQFCSAYGYAGDSVGEAVRECENNQLPHDLCVQNVSCSGYGQVCSAGGYAGASVQGAIDECSAHSNRSICAQNVACSGFGQLCRAIGFAGSSADAAIGECVLSSHQ